MKTGVIYKKEKIEILMNTKTREALLPKTSQLQRGTEYKNNEKLKKPKSRKVNRETRHKLRAKVLIFFPIFSLEINRFIIKDIAIKKKDIISRLSLPLMTSERLNVIEESAARIKKAAEILITPVFQMDNFFSLLFLPERKKCEQKRSSIYHHTSGFFLGF